MIAPVRIWYMDDDGVRHVGVGIVVTVPPPPKPKTILQGVRAYYAFVWSCVRLSANRMS